MKRSEDEKGAPPQRGERVGVAEGGDEGQREEQLRAQMLRGKMTGKRRGMGCLLYTHFELSHVFFFFHAI